MASITIRNLDPSLKAKLRVQAANHARSMEEEVRQILRTALQAETAEARGEGLGARIHRRFAALSGIQEDVFVRSREPMREPPKFDDIG